MYFESSGEPMALQSTSTNWPEWSPACVTMTHGSADARIKMSDLKNLMMELLNYG